MIVMPAEAGIQVLNGIARIMRDLKNLIAVPAPQAGFFSLFVQRKETKRKHAPDGANTPLRFSPVSALASTRRAHNTRLGLKHEARFSRSRLRCSGAPYGDLNMSRPARRLIRDGEVC